MLQLRLENDIDVAIGHFDFGVGVVLPRPRRAAPAALPDALLNAALAAGSSSDEPAQMIREDWKLLAANLTCTSQWLNLVATPRDLLAWIGGNTRDGPAIQPSNDFVDYRSWEEQTHAQHTIAHTHRHRVRALTHTCTHMDACTHARAESHTYARRCARLHSQKQSHTHTHTHTRARARARTASQVGHPDGYRMRMIYKEPVAFNTARLHHLRGCGRDIVFALCASAPRACAPWSHAAMALCRGKCVFAGSGHWRTEGYGTAQGLGLTALGLRVYGLRA